MIPVPKKFKIVVGAAEGSYKLTAFDHALMKAGISNVNLIRISSILPPQAEQDQSLQLAPGSLTPTAYGTTASDRPGTTISAAVGIGFSPDTFGVIMEFSGECSRQEAEEQVSGMIKEAFELRSLPLKDVQIQSVEHVVEKAGAVIAAVVLAY